MRLAFSTLAFPSHPLDEVAHAGRDWGYEGIELRLIDGELIDPATVDRDRVRRTIKDSGLAVTALDSSIRLTQDGAEQELRDFLELANAWEAPSVRVFGGPVGDGGAERKEGLAAAARTLEATAPVAERLGVQIGLETHDAFSASPLVAEVLAMVPSSSVGAVWDSHHPYRMGEQAAETFANLGDRLTLAQVKDARRSDDQPSGWQLVLLGEGEVPVRDMLRLLAASDYDDWVSVEWEKKWHPEIEEPEVALPQHLELLREWLKEDQAG